jgi:surface antigen
MAENHRSAPWLAMAASLLAMAVIYLGWQLGRVADSAQQLSQQLPTALQTLQSYQPVVTDGVSSVEQFNRLLQQGLQQSQQLQAWLPVAEQQAAQANQSLQAVSNHAPGYLQQLTLANQRIEASLRELQQWRPLVAQLLEESSAYRGAIPQYLQQIDGQIASINQAASNASSGVLQGIVVGAITLPWNLLKGVGEILDPRSLSAQKLTTQDRALIAQAITDLLASEKIDSLSWSNPKTAHHGDVVHLSSIQSDRCRQLLIRNYIDGQKEEFKREVCRLADGQWRLK